MQLARFARARFCHLPTALEPLPRLTAHLGGPQILVKRDDATGLGFGGNKTRKLEFLIGSALAEGTDTLVTAGGVQSNHCRQTAAAAARHGLACALVLQRRVAWNHPDYERGGNILLDRLAGADRAARLMATSAHELTDAECVEVWRMLCKAPAGGRDQRIHVSADEEAAIIAEWRRLTGR
jgi:L-cysteate sulfo-lyase